MTRAPTAPITATKKEKLKNQTKNRIDEPQDPGPTGG
jgi:hypothetical protein